MPDAFIQSNMTQDMISEGYEAKPCGSQCWKNIEFTYLPWGSQIIFSLYKWMMLMTIRCSFVQIIYDCRWLSLLISGRLALRDFNAPSDLLLSATTTATTIA